MNPQNMMGQEVPLANLPAGYDFTVYWAVEVDDDDGGKSIKVESEKHHAYNAFADGQSLILRLDDPEDKERSISYKIYTEGMWLFAEARGNTEDPFNAFDTPEGYEEIFDWFVPMAAEDSPVIELDFLDVGIEFEQNRFTFNDAHVATIYTVRKFGEEDEEGNDVQGTTVGITDMLFVSTGILTYAWKKDGLIPTTAITIDDVTTTTAAR